MKKGRFSNWWFMAVNGLVFALFGLLIMLMSEDAIKSLLRYFGFVMLVMGGVLLIVGINQLRRDRDGAMLLIESIASLAVGIGLLFFPQASVALFLLLIGIWAIIIGIVQLVILVNVKTRLRSGNIMLINSLLTIGIGIALLFNPFAWAIFIVKIIGGMSMIFGITLVYFSFLLKSLKGDPS